MAKVAVLCLMLLICCGIPNSFADDNTGALAVVDTEDNDGVTVEENGEDSVQVSHGIEPPTSQFQPTHQWQQVKQGQSIPAGLHVRLNMETGEREAKLMDGDSGLKYWKQGDREGMMNTNKQRFSVDELKRALKDFKTTKLDETDLQREEDVKSKFRSYNDLKKDFQAMNVGVKTDGQIIDELTKKMKNKDIKKDELLTILIDLEYYLHQIDNAVVFRDYGGLPVLVQILNTTQSEDIKIETAMIDNAVVFRDYGGLPILVQILNTTESEDIKIETAMIDNAVVFRDYGGLPILVQILNTTESEDIKIETAMIDNAIIFRDYGGLPVLVQILNTTESEDIKIETAMIDNAVVFRDYGGLPILVQILNTTLSEDIKIETAMVIGAATSSNPQVQISAIEAGALHILLKMISTESSMNVRKKMLYAISTICRNFPHAQRSFLQLGGLSALGQIFQEPNSEKLKIKAIAFLNDLLVEKDDAEKFVNKDKSSEVERLRQYSLVELREAMLEQGWCELIPKLLIVTEHDSREQVLKAMKTLSVTCLDKFVGFRTILDDLHKQYKDLAVQEKHEDDDDDQYFSNMLTLVRDLISSINVKEEL